MKKNSGLLTIALFVLIASSCTKAVLPTLSTIDMAEITPITAKAGGVIIDDGGALLIERGVCWSKYELPTIDHSIAEDSLNNQTFSLRITGLEPNTKYYLRAFATNSEGTAYGNSVMFYTLDISNGDSFVDSRDGKVYPTINLGDQIWMASNLAYASENGNYAAYDNNPENIALYGYLYDWQTARVACPDGWHLPGNEEWLQLFEDLGGINKAGAKLKATGNIQNGTGLWLHPNTGAIDLIGFSSLPGGQCNLSSGSFGMKGFSGYWWTADEFFSSKLENGMPYTITMGYMDEDAILFSNLNHMGCSVRCLKNK
jgi:uncharacterized protein (TIGR02145 family)